MSTWSWGVPKRTVQAKRAPGTGLLGGEPRVAEVVPGVWAGAGRRHRARARWAAGIESGWSGGASGPGPGLWVPAVGGQVAA